jgi:hypothetical protein
MTDPQEWAAPGAQPPGAQPPSPVPPNAPQGQPPPQAGPPHPGYQHSDAQQPGYQYPGSPYQGAPGMPPGPPGYGSAAPKPGVIPLRPLGVGEILDGAISYIRANPVATLGLAAIVVTSTQLIQVPLTGLALNELAGVVPGPGGEVAPESVFGAFAGLFGSSAVNGLVTFIATTVLSGLLIAVLGQAVLGRSMRIGEAWAAVRSRIPGLLGLALLIVLLLGLVLIAGGIPFVILAIAESGMVGLPIGLLFVFLSWGVALFLGVSWSLAAPAYVLEGIPVTAAMRRSFRLVRKQWWRVFGIVLLGGIIALIIGSILSVPFSFAADALAGEPDPAVPFGTLSVPGLVVASVGTIIATTVTAPFSAGISGLLYFDQRIRREALDIELARAAQL